MHLPFYWVDAFTDRVFAGNPAGVVPLECWLPDERMQQIAFENGLSETAFIVRTGPGCHDLRWFTPAIEVKLCGHATLASAHVLWSELGETADRITFASRSGPLHVLRRGDGLELDFPSQPAAPAAAPVALVQALGCRPEYVGLAGARWLCVLTSAEEVRALQPDHARLARLQPGRVIVSAPGADCDFVSRFFAPDAGIPEDPVTGSAHCTLTPYWAQRLGRTQLHARQVSRRGGELWCELRGDRVGIAGRAVTYLRGTLLL